MLNKLHFTHNQIGPSQNEPLLKNKEASPHQVWIPIQGGKVGLNELLIQIETAARELIQNEKNNSNESPREDNRVFTTIAQDLINSSIRPDDGSGINSKNDNAKPAQADTKE